MSMPRKIPDAPVRILAWSVVVTVALVAFAPEWLLFEPGERDRFVAAMVYLPLAVGATLWTTGSLRPALGVVIEDAFGHRSDLANAASGCTTMTFALFGLAFASLNTPVELCCGDRLGPAVSARLGTLFVALGIATLVITVRSVKKRNERELHRRVVARAREEIRKDLNEGLAKKPPPVSPAPSAW